MALERPDGWISKKEYRQGLDERAMPNEMQSGVRYSLLSRLGKNSMLLEARRQPVEITHSEHVGGLAVVRFVVEALKMEGPFPPGVNPPVDMHYGGIMEANGFFRSDSYSLPIPIKQMYFSFDTSGLDDGLLRLYEEAKLPTQA